MLKYVDEHDSMAIGHAKQIQFRFIKNIESLKFCVKYFPNNSNLSQKHKIQYKINKNSSQ